MEMPAQAETATKAALCEMRSVTHDYTLPNGTELRALENISLSIRPNEVVALLGPSGCGKSTMLRILGGLIRPTQGEVLWHGKPLQGLNPGFSIVFQSFALLPWMTVLENIEAALKPLRLSADAMHERSRRAIKTVGLTGFEGAYPKELSGGMKQRVGMARALSVDPEVLFLDQPFSQVDALTAESLRAEVLDIWAEKDRNPSSILMVSHDITEVTYMADRIVVLGSKPGRILKIVDNRLPRPRTYRSPALLRLVEQLHDIITGAEMPDIPASGDAHDPFLVEPLPDAPIAEITGLIEYLDAHGGSMEMYRVAAETQREFGRILTIAKAGEMLDLLDTPRGAVMLTALGRRFVAAAHDERKAIWRSRLLNLQVFKDVKTLLGSGARVDKDLVIDALVLRLPQEDTEHLFSTLVNWGRFGELFTYDQDTETLQP